MNVNQTLAPIVKSVIVPAPPERAFRLFTEQMSAWWPLATHSIGGVAAREVRFECAAGGRIIEYGEDGPLGSWGTVSDWDPPSTVSFSWHPGSDPQEAGQVTVRFRAVEGGTEVELTHTGWERHPDGARARQLYDTGWVWVLDGLVKYLN
jgi:uncharacterized protein YndB with AHSA1/START domain